MNLRNKSTNILSVGGYTWQPGQTIPVTNMTNELAAEIALGTRLEITSGAYAAVTALAALAGTFTTVTDSSGGTAATVTDDELTIAAVTDVATAANAIATLAEEIDRLKTIVQAQETRSNLLLAAVKAAQTELNAD